MSSYAFTETFTRTHARRLAGRVTSDLRQSHLLHGSPSEGGLGQYMDELEELLSGGYVQEYQFGFQRDGQCVWSLRYKVGPDGMLNTSGAAGGVPARISTLGAVYFNYLTFSDAWFALSASARGAVEGKLPFIRTTGGLPGTANGYWVTDRTFAAGGVALERSTFKQVS